jgi:uncharacterized protein YcnI
VKRATKVVFLACLLTGVTVATANAHVEFNPDTVKANVNQTLVLNVPHDCSSNTKTTLVKFQFPKSINTSTFRAVGIYQHGAIVKTWHEKITRASGIDYLAISGPAVTTGPDGGKNALTIKFKLTPVGAKGTQLKFPAVQYCSNGTSVNWVQPRPADGSDPAESATPVPVLNLN